MSQLPFNPDEAPTANRVHDYINLLPKGVYPTTKIGLLEVNDHVLVIKDVKWGNEVTRAQRKLFSLMTRFGSSPDAPGSMSVVCVWGEGNTSREWQMFDYMGVHPPKAGTRDDFRALILDWWVDHGGRRP